ncbi:MAG: isoaspartyl peptidase/L-asparaginase [Lysobacterales bacterium CG17_big_fil_post_rev_8_21_14_2_50_64_11]|nr:MAG: isoaspartyl peptidase/L-asparaginase [Xanthomonadales bacterium CG17_big_fil_post_rev_8_21_14_2_50_64_11]PIX61492.1 MAG: isoaspartyl peptidase/L-asparaginase [Xanthomonadales bacterium CG_4_10_14_3_um_filter_64_11]
MNKRVFCAALCALTMALPVCAATPTALVIHGGAGTINRDALTAEREQAIRAALDRALDAGHAVLAAGGPALDAVAAVVVVLEDSPYFNAGKGAVFNAEGVNELDSAIMDGSTQRAGAVAGVHRVRNPVLLARAVMEQSPHVMLVGDGAEAFASAIGMALVEPAWFRTEERWQQLQDAKARASAQVALPRSYYFGTVGAVALDSNGHIAAATSTGGMTNKRWGRVGDAPIIGAGTWADAGCGVSATGWGEFFIRLHVAADICARMAYRGDTLTAAAESVVLQRLPAMGGDGGVIAIDGQGNIAMPFNTAGMYRAWIKPDGSRGTAVYANP